MPRIMLLVGLAFTITGCISVGGKPDPVVQVHKITCPSESPPEIPDISPRPEGDLRLLAADRIRLEGDWKAIQIRQNAYTNSWQDCSQ